MSNQESKNEVKKNLFCRNHYCSALRSKYKGLFKESENNRVLYCSYGDSCRGAHNERDIELFDEIKYFNSINKSKYNFVKLYLAIQNVITNEISKVKDIKFKDGIINYKTYDFIKLLQFWRELAKHYRKLAKEITNVDYPKFMLSDAMEGMVWSLSRLINQCPNNIKLTNAIKNKTQIIVWDVCLANSNNCKEGVHNFYDSLCIDDFYNGKCNCMDLETYNTKKKEIHKNLNYTETEQKYIDTIQKLKEEISDLEKKEKESNKEVSDDGWNHIKSKPNYRNKISQYKTQLYQNENELTKLKEKMNSVLSLRRVHFTDSGMIPFNKAYESYLEEEKIRIEKEKATKPEIKLTHEISKDISKPVIKLKIGIKK